MKLSKNFSLKEFTKSNTATRLGLDNEPTLEHIDNLISLCVNVLQPLRDALGLPIKLTSGYRSYALNKAINGSQKSDHSFGRAADVELYIDGVEDNAKLYNTIKELNLPFYQIIWEFGNDSQPSWVHIAYREDNVKRQCLKAYKEDGKTKYKTI